MPLVQELLTGWMGFAAMGLMLATILAAIIYMLGAALMNDKMKTWARMELVEIAYSAVIIVFAMGALIPLMNSVIDGALDVADPGATNTYMKLKVGVGYQVLPVDVCGHGGLIAAQPEFSFSDACHIRLATYYLRTVFEEGKTFGATVLNQYTWATIFSETAITVSTVFAKAGTVMWTPWKGFFTLRNMVYDMVLNWDLIVMFIAKFQQVLIKFIAVAAFPVLFAAGVILRTFTFTRRLGGLMIGLAIALYYIFPAFYALGGLMLIDMKNEARYAWVNDPDANPDGENNPDPPIINTIYLGISEDGEKIGDITILEGKVEHAKAKREIEEQGLPEDLSDMLLRRDDGSGGSASLDMGEKTADSEKEGIAMGMIKFTKGFINSIKTFALPTSWHPGGEIEVAARLTFFATFFALFGIIGTIAATRSLSATFGGDIELAGLTRLI